MCAKRKAIKPSKNVRSAEISNTSPASENKIPSPNQNVLPCKAVLEYSQRNRQSITAGLAKYSSRCKFLDTAITSNTAKIKTKMSQRIMDCSHFIHVIARAQPEAISWLGGVIQATRASTALHSATLRARCQREGSPLSSFLLIYFIAQAPQRILIIAPVF